MSGKKVLLVYPYFYTGVNKDQLFSPLGIGLLAAALKQKGLEVMVCDCTFLTFKEAVAKAEKYQPDITGVYVMTTLAKNALSLLEKLRTLNPHSLYAAGGPLPTLYPAKFAAVFDFVFKGEAALSFPAFCRDYLNAVNRSAFLAGLDPAGYPGLCSVKRGPFDSPAAHLSKQEIDACPLTDRQGFDHRAYQKMGYRYAGKKTATIMTTYGCKFSCDFCSKPIFGNEFRLRSLDRVYAEIRDIISYGYDSLWIADDLFTYDPQFLLDFCGGLMAQGLRISWSCLSRVDNVTEELAGMMKKAGCAKVYLGIESGNDHVLQLMNKKIDTGQVRRGVEIFKNSGIACAGFFIVGYPGETVETVEETFDFALSLALDEISFNVPYPLPGSGLYQRVTDISADDWTIENEARFLYKSEFDEKWLKRRIGESLERFTEMKESSPKRA